MKRTPRALALLLLLLPCALLGPRAAGADPSCGEVLARTVSTYRSARTLKAAFVHTLEAPSLNQREREEGILYLARGGKMRWEYSSPQGKLAWADGKRSYLYLPEENQVLVQPLGNALPVRILMGSASVESECRCLAATRFGGEVELSLAVVDGDAGIRDLTLKVEEAGFLATFLAYRDPLGNRIALTFRDIQKDIPLPPSLFEVAIPRGAKVIEAR